MSQKKEKLAIIEADAKDIAELRQNILLYKTGEMQEERFKQYRLTRGVYGQRQYGVQMFRLKIPFGRISAAQLSAVADLSDRYSTGNLHLTTRQNIQLHHVKLDDSPAVWEGLSAAGLTAREACGNTVRNITASALAGIDIAEPFDVSPYVQAVFEYFLRNPICQDMGRKIKIAFSSSEADTALSYIHDFGFIPRVKTLNFKELRGFKVLIAGGLGAQDIEAQTVYEFLPEDEIIPFIEAAIRVFDRHGEREKRHKARLKFLVKQLGLQGFLDLVNAEYKALKHQKVLIDRDGVAKAEIPDTSKLALVQPYNFRSYALWLRTNVLEQKQYGYYAVQLKISLGDLSSEKARALAAIVPKYAADDIRITINQGLLLRFLRPEALPHLYNALYDLGLSDAGFDSLGDVTACPGTDTCNLAVTNSTALALELEDLIKTAYPQYLENRNLSIKISGCMNSCGQHIAASIGFHGSSIKKDNNVIPAMQVVLGGGIGKEGKGYMAEKIIKLPTRRIPQAVQLLLADFEANQLDAEGYPEYVLRLGNKHFYQLLKPLADVTNPDTIDFIDWGQELSYRQEIGVGECAGVSYDVVSTILNDARVKINAAKEAFLDAALSDSIYQSYSAFVIAAKALLLSIDVKCNTQIGVIQDFEKHFVATNIFSVTANFEEQVLQINKNEASEDFAEAYFKAAESFVQWAENYRKSQLEDKLVVEHYYQA